MGGLALGMVVIFAVRIKNSPAREKKEKTSKSTKASTSKEEKIEVACPTCDRRLRVPNTYTGAVRCPECETKFDVEAKVETPIQRKSNNRKKNQNLHKICFPPRITIFSVVQSAQETKGSI